MSGRPKYLLDTNVLSETRKQRPDQHVVSFFSKVNPSLLSVSVLSLGELRKGAARKEKSDAAAAHRIRMWVDELESSFENRILGIDTAIANRWGELDAERSRPTVDTLLAATAIIHELTLVTRNTKDFEGIPVDIWNPWKL